MFNARHSLLALATLLASTAASAQSSGWRTTSTFRDGNLACRYVPVPHAQYHDQVAGVATSDDNSALAAQTSGIGQHVSANHNGASPKVVYERHCWLAKSDR